MQGQTILANVVIKSTVQVEKVANIQTYLYPDGFFGPLLEFQASRREGVNEIEGSLLATIDRTDQTFDGGARVTSFPDGRPTIKEAVKGYDEIQNYVARGAIQRAAPGGKIRINGKIEYFGFDRDVVYTQYEPGPGRQDSGETDENWTGEFGARYDRKLSPRTDLQLVFLQNLGDETYGSTFVAPGRNEVYRERDKTGESILRGELKQRRSDTLSLEGSLEGAYNFLDGNIRYSNNGAPVDIGPPHVKVEELRGEAAGKAVWRANSEGHRRGRGPDGGLAHHPERGRGPGAQLLLPQAPGAGDLEPQQAPTSCASGSSARSASWTSATSSPRPT